MRQRLFILSKLMVPIRLLGIAIVIGVFGFILIEHYSFLDALYMTVITVAAVGFQEVHPLSPGGKVFVIVLIFFNLGLFTYFIALLTRFFLDGEFIKQYKLVKMHDKIETLSDHVIICGFGRNGKEAAQVLHANHIPFVVVEEREEADGSKDPEVKFRIKGNATRDEVLVEAGIKSARALICTLPVDADNVFAVLTAKQLNPKIRIISRASQDSSVNKLKVAGANNVIMPDKIGGAHMATLVMIPDVLEFIELLTTRSNEQFKVAELLAQKSSVIGELDLWQSTGCTILGIKNPTEYILNPPPDYYLSPGERLIVMGNEQGISDARRLV